MKILITGICGFVGSTLAKTWAEQDAGHVIYGIDNFIRPGSETNRMLLKKIGVKVFHADLRCFSDFEALPLVDYVVDAAASPSVHSGIDQQTSSRQLVEHNLWGTVNILEYCNARKTGLILTDGAWNRGGDPLEVAAGFDKLNVIGFPPAKNENIRQLACIGKGNFSLVKDINGITKAIHNCLH